MACHNTETVATRKTKPLTREQALEIVFPRMERVKGQRFTQDTPVSPDVWLLYATTPPDTKHEILFAPNRKCSLDQLVKSLRIGLELAVGKDAPPVIYNQSHAMARLTLKQLLRATMPLSVWWVRELQINPKQVLYQLPLLKDEADLEGLMMNPADLLGSRRAKGKSAGKVQVYSEDLLHMVRIVGSLLLGRPLPPPGKARHAYFLEALKEQDKLFGDLPVEAIWARVTNEVTSPLRPPLWRAFHNREAESAVYMSRQTIKADAGGQLFTICCSGLRWAIIDSGVDAKHPAFTKNKTLNDDSRVARTYDFTRLKDLLYSNFEDKEIKTILDEAALSEDQWAELKLDLQTRLKNGRFFEWELLEKVLRIEHNEEAYRPPENQHGTHVAGILAADWKRGGGQMDSTSSASEDDVDLIGICPDLKIYDLRVFDKDGFGDEFSILAALQFVRYLNANRDSVVVHGVNLSFSLKHSVDSYACGATPVCEECSRLSGAGVVVVAAAGNRGFDSNSSDGFGIYREVSITDPGNAEDVITVGSTHRQMPHKYGISYFSSRGPTGDGRRKPDLVAPGEKILSTIPGGKAATLDGTSMAAPHVSGAAALLMARHKELVGQPRRIKEILCRTATDLDRERGFQGAGLVDILRALQSI